MKPTDPKHKDTNKASMGMRNCKSDMTTADLDKGGKLQPEQGSKLKRKKPGSAYCF